MIQEIKGNLISLALDKKFDVIVHGCNCQGTMKSGIAKDFVKYFKADQFFSQGIENLGNIEYNTFVIGEKAIWNLNDGKNNKKEHELIVVNAYTQIWSTSTNPAGPLSQHIDYDAFSVCLKKINTIFKGKNIGIPKIGAGRANGNWDLIKLILSYEITDCNLTIVYYDEDSK